MAASTLLLSACRGHPKGPAIGAPASSGQAGDISVTSSAFTAGGTIPSRYTCDGPNTPIPVMWSPPPVGTVELAVVISDRDANGFVHWALAGLKPSQRTPAGGVPGRNDFGRTGYRGPCPQKGPAHHYVVTVLALDYPSDLKPGFSPEQLNNLPALARGQLTGTYSRRGST